MIDCYVINLDRCTERWEKIEAGFAKIDTNQIRLIRVSAIDVAQQPVFRRAPFYHPFRFRLNMGRPATPGEIGCYHSHLKALRTFLDSGAPFAVICEDDVIPAPELVQILEEVTQFSGHWNLLRLAKCRKKNFHTLTQLPSGQTLGVGVKGFIFTAAYMVDRLAAETILKRCASVTLPWDLALHRGYVGVTEMSLLPGAFQLGVIAGETTIGARKSSFSIFSLTVIIYRIWSRLRRYSIQYYRVRKFCRREKKGGVHE